MRTERRTGTALGNVQYPPAALDLSTPTRGLTSFDDRHRTFHVGRVCGARLVCVAAGESHECYANPERLCDACVGLRKGAKGNGL